MRRTEDMLTTRVRATLGSAYDAKAEYIIVRPGMVGSTKYADCTQVGEFDEDTRNGTKLVILRRPAPKPPPAPTATERVRAALGGRSKPK